MTNNNSSSGCSIGGLTSLMGMGAGAYHGFCDAQGIPFQKENLEALLTYGPAALGATFGALGGAACGGVMGGFYGATESSNYFEKTSTKIKKGAAMGCLGALGLGAAGATIGALATGLVTVIGYGAGYVTGYVLK